MNFTTHVMLGILVGALFFNRPEVALLVGVGSAIPDLDREYGFFKRESFRDHQIHRALFHNFLFFGLLYLLNPFLSLGAFLHTLLDALTTAQDRGVEWLFPFSRLVKSALYDESGKKINPLLNPSGNKSSKISFYQYDPIRLTRLSDEDLKEYKPSPWRRTYGPALSGKLLDQGIFLGSLALTLLLIFFSKLGVQAFAGLSRFQVDPSFSYPFLIGSLGLVVQLASGELDMRKFLFEKRAEDTIYRVVLATSFGLMAFAILLGGILNPAIVLSSVAILPYVLSGAAVVGIVAFLFLQLAFRFRPRQLKAAGGKEKRHIESKEAGEGENKGSKSETGGREPVII